MNKFLVATAAAAMAVIISGPSMAASSKAVAGYNNLGLVGVAQGGTSLMNLNIKTANASDLMINVALQCNITTQTKGKTNTDGSGNIVADTASADAGLAVQVTVDGETVVPATPVTYCYRSQTLTVELGQALADCTLIDGALGGDFCTLSDQSVELILSTLSTHSFNFIVPDVGPGEHTVHIKALVAAEDGAEVGDASANAYIGEASATVEEVRFVKGLDVDLTGN